MINKILSVIGDIWMFFGLIGFFFGMTFPIAVVFWWLLS